MCNMHMAYVAEAVKFIVFIFFTCLAYLLVYDAQQSGTAKQIVSEALLIHPCPHDMSIPDGQCRHSPIMCPIPINFFSCLHISVFLFEFDCLHLTEPDLT